VYIGAGATVAAAGVATWCGIQTLDQKSNYDKTKSQADLNLGKQLELDTNVALAVTGGLAVLTAVTAVFFVDWHSTGHAEDPPKAQVGFGPGSVMVRGSF
jgi:hypothetical protein